MSNNEHKGVKIRSLTGRVQMTDVILALLAIGDLPLAAKVALDDLAEHNPA